ncbi:MAG: hypothetical protein ACPGVH_05065 [Chitinophagales bacterium]
MKIIDFIKGKIDSLIVEFPTIKIQYSIDSFQDANYLKILPAKTFNNSIELKRKQAEILMSFIDAYPDEELTFLTESSMIEMNEVIYTKSGHLYSFTKYYELSETILEFMTKNFKSSRINHVDSAIVMSNYTKSSCIEQNDLLLVDSYNEISSMIKIKNTFDNDSCVAGESDYAMAA